MRSPSEQYEVSYRKMLNRKALAERLDHSMYQQEKNWYINSNFRRVPPIKGWYKDTGRYFKGKIHCSCPICSAKSNNKRQCRGEGKRKTYKISDIRKMDAMDYVE